jgi:hypothetical protein
MSIGACFVATVPQTALCASARGQFPLDTGSVFDSVPPRISQCPASPFGNDAKGLVFYFGHACFEILGIRHSSLSSWVGLGFRLQFHMLFVMVGDTNVGWPSFPRLQSQILFTPVCRLGSGLVFKGCSSTCCSFQSVVLSRALFSKVAVPHVVHSSLLSWVGPCFQRLQFHMLFI